MEQDERTEQEQRQVDEANRQRVERSDPENREGRSEKVDMSEAAHQERLVRRENGTASDEDNRLIKLYRKQRNDEYDRRSDEVRAAIEERDGKAPGQLGRNAETVVVTGEAEPALVDPEDTKGGVSSPGNSSVSSPERPASSESSTKQDPQLTAPTTAPHSNKPSLGN